MNVIVHYPKTKEGLCDLQKRVADVHAEAALQYIKKMPCPKGQRLQLLNEIIEKGLP